MITRITEQSSFGQTEIGKTDRTVRNVLILRTPSQNGTRVYTGNALLQIAKLSEGVKVFADHVEDQRETRSVKDLIGALESVRVNENEIRGTLRYLPASAKMVEALIENPILGVGLSISVAGGVTRDSVTKKSIVEMVETVFSVDLVTEAGATNSLKESLQRGTEDTRRTAEETAADYDKAIRPGTPAKTAEPKKNGTAAERESFAYDRAIRS